MSDSVDDPVPLFQPLGSFTPPATPADERLRHVVAWLHAVWRHDDAKAMVADDRLQKATLQRLDQVVAPPACGPVLAELQATVQKWLAEKPVTSHLKLVVLPPCDRNDVVGTWAQQHGHRVLPPPTRAALAADGPAELPDLAGEGVLVVPSLDRWFLRERNGLAHVRKLLEAVGTLRRPTVIGCGSWAWQFLATAVGADLVLPTGVCFRAFDAPRLRRWLSDLSTADATGGVEFRLAGGVDVLGTGADDRASADFFAKLAARSLGIPWVAWHLWRSSLRSDRDAAAGTVAEKGADEGTADTAAGALVDPGKQTLWIAALDELVLPGHHPQVALLVFHALLIHEHLTLPELHRVLPMAGETNIVHGLVASGFLERVGDSVRCRPTAYPAIRGGLAAAGFPMDQL